jgi:glycine cleavage system H protein
MLIPTDLRYSSDHEWAKANGDVIRVGITDYAQDALGDVVFVDLPKVGAAIDAHGTIGEVESTKSVSEIYAPVGGTVTAVNDTLSNVHRSRSTPTRTAKVGSARSRRRAAPTTTRCSTRKGYEALTNN